MVKYFAKSILGSDDVRAYNLCKALRKYDYAMNCLPNNIVFKYIALYQNGLMKAALDFFNGFFRMVTEGRSDYELIAQEALS